MNITTQWIIDSMEEWAPAKWAMPTDNVGLLIGDRTRPVSHVLTALDLTEDVLKEAVQGRYDFIITHHPLISRHTQPINRITADDVLGKKILTLIANGIGLFTAHTNLDVAPGGVNDLIFDLVGLQNKERLTINPNDPEFPGMGLAGTLASPMTLAALSEHIKNVFSLNALFYVGDKDRIINKVGLCGGNGTALISDALEKKCDVYISGDLQHHLSMDTIESGLALIDATHYATEAIVAPFIADYIYKKASSQGVELVVQSSKSSKPVFSST